MNDKEEHLKYCFSCRFDGDPFKNDEILYEFRDKVLSDVVEMLEGMKDPENGMYHDAVLDKAIKKIKEL